MDRRSAVKVDSLVDQVSWGRTPEWGLEQSAGTMRSRRGGARSRASSIERRAVCEREWWLLLRWCLLVKSAVVGENREWSWRAGHGRRAW